MSYASTPFSPLEEFLQTIIYEPAALEFPGVLLKMQISHSRLSKPECARSETWKSVLISSPGANFAC